MQRAVHEAVPVGWRRAVGFTLFEMLVVLGLVALLLVLLLPATGLVMEIQRETLCRGNLRQLSAAVFYYQSEQGLLPKTGEWVPPGYDWTAASAINGTLFPYVHDTGVYGCPTFYRGVKDLALPNGRGGPATRRTYSMNAFGDEINTPLRLNAVRQPAARLFLAEENWWAPSLVDGTTVAMDWLNDGMLHWLQNGLDDGFGTFHRGGVCQAGYLDGHVGQFKVDKYFQWKTKVCKD